MDPERQPLISRCTDLRCRIIRPLTYEEVLNARQEVAWRRARFFLVLVFWAIIAMIISLIVSILVTAPNCTNYYDEIAPSVPPAHLTFAPLMSRGRLNDDVSATASSEGDTLELYFT